MNDFASDKATAGGVNIPEDDAPVMPLIGGVIRPEGLPEAADLDVTAIKTPNRMLNQGTMLIVGAFVVAAGTLWAMKVGTTGDATGGTSSAIEQKIEQTLIQLSNPEAIAPTAGVHPDHLKWVKGGAEAISKIFNVDYTEKQVPIEYVKKNPFRLAVVQAPAGDGPAVPVNDAIAKRLKQLEGDFAKLKLQTIMKGRPNVAIINDEICREGQKIGAFTIQKIENLSVVLAAENHEFTLQMDAGPRR